jgi:4a-hydroxytetrahydrobiopterin dehydratase
MPAIAIREETSLHMERILNEARTLLKAYGRKLTQLKIPHTLLLSRGDPRNKIVELSDEYEIDLVIIGRRGLNQITRLVMGSVSSHVLHNTSKPVLVVKRPPAPDVSRAKLEKDELTRVLNKVPEWKLADDNSSICREFEFENFNEAWQFMNKVAVEAEKLDHHPDWNNVYNKVHIKLSTHTCKSVSKRDVVLAHKIDHIWNIYADAKAHQEEDEGESGGRRLKY